MSSTTAFEETAAHEQLMPVVYSQLKAIAANRMASERRDHTLQATALVHEAFCRLVGDRRLSWEGQSRFYVAASEAMRRVLLDHARKHHSKKRGSGRRSEASITVADLGEDRCPDRALALEQALDVLAAEEPRAYEVVRLRFFGGLDVAETAHLLAISERTVMREWAYARARLQQLLDG